MNHAPTRSEDTEIEQRKRCMLVSEVFARTLTLIATRNEQRHQPENKKGAERDFAPRH
jgi:hypothetical protein